MALDGDGQREVIRRGQRVELRRPTAADRDEFLAAVAASRELHHPWVAPPADADAFADYLLRSGRPDGAAFLLRQRDDEALVGAVNVNNIVQGAFHSAFLGYYAFVPHQGHGLMREGLGLVIDDAFGPLGLHRLEANIQPGNLRSVHLVEGLGFRFEGWSTRYLFIDGAWRDHHRLALTAEEWTTDRSTPAGSPSSATGAAEEGGRAGS